MLEMLFNIRPFNLIRLLNLNSNEYIKKMNFYANIIVMIFVILIILGIIMILLLKGIENFSFGEFGQYLRVLCSLFIVVSMAFLFVQSCTIKLHAEANHALKKSYKSLEMLYNLNNDLKIEYILARKIIEKINRRDTENLINNECISIAKEDYEILRLCIEMLGLKNRKLLDGEIKKVKIRLTYKENIILRSLIIKYLNVLEVVLCARKSGLIDKDIVDQELDYLVTFAVDGKIVLDKFRNAIGQNGYPGIYQFCNDMIEFQERNIKNKDIKF